MPLDIDKMLAGHAHALSLGSRRMQLLAANVANADTPNYKARDIDFTEAMRSAGDQEVRMRVTDAKHIPGNVPAGAAEAKYRIPDQPSMDGNTVDAQRESAAIAETAVRYQATLTFLNQRIRGLRQAITGGRS